jgi:hypothetical protein
MDERAVHRRLHALNGRAAFARAIAIYVGSHSALRASGVEGLAPLLSFDHATCPFPRRTFESEGDVEARPALGALGEEVYEVAGMAADELRGGGLTPDVLHPFSESHTWVSPLRHRPRE